MPCWPLWPPLSAASTSPSRSRHPRRPSSSCRQRAVLRRRVVLAPSIAVAPRCPSPLSRHRAVHRRPLPLRSRFIAVALVPSLAVHHRQGAVVQDYFEWPRQQYLVVPRHRRPSSGGARALAVARRWARTTPPRRVPRGHPVEHHGTAVRQDQPVPRQEDAALAERRRRIVVADQTRAHGVFGLGRSSKESIPNRRFQWSCVVCIFATRPCGARR